MNIKRQLLIDTALELFYENGINSIGINEVLKVSGIAKKTLYRHFESKDALILAALEQRHAIFMVWLEEKLLGAGSNDRVVIQLFNALESWFTDSEPMLGNFRGCFFINSSAEFSDPNSHLSRFCQSHKAQVRQLITRHVKDSDPMLVDALCIMKEGAITTAYVTGDHTAATKCIDILKRL
ncbi:TetR/AcrR family transcriptional regulator [Shewanella sp. Choline-02u-19]|uniref:TetR/AcrR family transcriptional regulator n=1 Tax=unclassified Shewanella TaxID=196818 RepID=UPI000C3458ED|nr:MULTISPECIES: TetR/AcrR family transcriptional regulator [unclassified Shewanella]PKH56037.1 TetR/AcrR family transcriptional regulator [Shewanella sp. Bg11-22]PKI30626.1 TetR/AcrR family transcriptional regulator [Shewanella sp. Choline-02u-19]